MCVDYAGDDCRRQQQPDRRFHQLLLQSLLTVLLNISHTFKNPHHSLTISLSHIRSPLKWQCVTSGAIMRKSQTRSSPFLLTRHTPSVCLIKSLLLKRGGAWSTFADLGAELISNRVKRLINKETSTSGTSAYELNFWKKFPLTYEACSV